MSIATFYHNRCNTSWLKKTCKYWALFLLIVALSLVHFYWHNNYLSLINKVISKHLWDKTCDVNCTNRFICYSIHIDTLNGSQFSLVTFLFLWKMSRSRLNPKEKKKIVLLNGPVVTCSYHVVHRILLVGLGTKYFYIRILGLPSFWFSADLCLVTADIFQGNS